METVPWAGAAAGVKLAALLVVPIPVVTEIGPAVAPAGTTAVIWAAESTVNVAFKPLNFTAVAPVKFAPLITTDDPTTPLAGLKELTIGGWGCAPPPAPNFRLMAVADERFTVIQTFCLAVSSVAK